MVTETLGERYALGDRLATGGMGSVYRARDTRLGREVAIKILKEEYAGDDRFVERFRREARAAAALAHPNIAGVYDYGEESGRHFIVMELVQGSDLARVMREEGPLPPERAQNIGTQIARALAHAHAAGVVHRDVKPANVIVSPSEVVKVTDFGIARAQADSALTATGTVMGTAQYISPEQASGEKVGPRSDVYSLGIVLYEMVTGTVPFTGDSAVAIAMRHLKDDVPAPSTVNPAVPPQLDRIVAAATSKRPEDRFEAAEFESLLEEAPAGETAAVTTPIAAGSTAVLPVSGTTAELEEEGKQWPFPAYPPRWDPRSIGRAVMAIFGVLLFVAIALLVYRLMEDDEPRRAARGAGGQDQSEQQQQPQEDEETYTFRDVTGQDYEAVRQILLNNGIQVERQDILTDAEEPETIIDQDPPPGSEVQAGDVVTLYVAVPEEAEPTQTEGGLEDVGDQFTPPGQQGRNGEGDD
jgi:predicted Ser/Thr protein kinase